MAKEEIYQNTGGSQEPPTDPLPRENVLAAKVQRPEQEELPKWAEGSPEALLCEEINRRLRDAEPGDTFEIRLTYKISRESIEKIRLHYERSKTKPCVVYTSMAGGQYTAISFEVREPLPEA